MPCLRVVCCSLTPSPPSLVAFCLFLVFAQMARAAPHKKIVKKRTAQVIRHQADRYSKLSHTRTWRKPKGIDNRVRRRFKGQISEPTIGYGSDKKTKFMRPDGLKTFLIRNKSDLEMLLMHNRVYAAEIAHGVSSAKRVGILKRAAELDIKVTNKNAKVRSQETA